MTIGQMKQTEADAAPEERKLQQALPLWIWVCLAAGVLALGIVIFIGLHSRSVAEANLVRTTDEDLVPTVAVIHPVPSGAAAQEIVLPGNVMAFIDTPI